MEKAYIPGSGLEVNEMDTTDRINVVLQQLPPMKGYQMEVRLFLKVLESHVSESGVEFLLGKSPNPYRW